jgi:thioredoxin-dependent peroxiredoxin
MLKVGDKAPEFTLAADDGKEVSLGDFNGKRLVIFFFPKANTPG